VDHAAVDAIALSKRFILRHNRAASLKVRFLGLLHREQREVFEEFWALKDVSMRIGHGESVGIVGRNGSGKSTFLKLIAGLHRPTSGRLLVARAARIGTLIELGVGFHPELNGTENVFLNAAIHGLSRPDIEAIYDRIVAYSGLGHFMDVPLKNYSSGMQMRLGFAVAANLDPDILLLDEIFAVGDEDFQKQCMKTIEQFSAAGRTIVFVSHAAPAIQAICDRVCLIDHGRLLYDGDVEGGFAEYHRLLEAQAAVPMGAPGMSASVESLDAPATGEGTSDLRGDWQLDFLRSEGLRRDHAVLEIGGRSAALLRYLDPGRYFGLAGEDGPFNFGGVPEVLDVVIASSLFSRLSLNRVAYLVATVLRRLRPGGRLYATWYDNPDPGSFDPILHPDGVTTYPDAEPYHHPFDVLAGVCGALGGRAMRIDDRSHPGGESVIVIVKSSGEFQAFEGALTQ
jgi:ABC-type polysaccharide/polyol phosphate transport system ATPase subunit